MKASTVTLSFAIAVAKKFGPVQASVPHRRAIFSDTDGMKQGPTHDRCSKPRHEPQVLMLNQLSKRLSLPQ
jgi:hypothetical protein